MIYHQMFIKSVASTSCAPELQSAMLPRNTKQISNLHHRERQRFRISHDSLYNVHVLAYDMDNFVKKMVTYPDLIVICGLDRIINELNQILQVKSQSPQLLSYDTTFQLGDYYILPLLFRYTIFTTSPVISALFLNTFMSLI